VVTLLPDAVDLRVLSGGCTEGLCADLFFSIVKEFWRLDDGDDVVSPF
jgi:hypothetical protein